MVRVLRPHGAPAEWRRSGCGWRVEAIHELDEHVLEAGLVVVGVLPDERDHLAIAVGSLMFPFLKTLFADGGYQGPQFAKALAKVLPHLDVEIVKRSDRVSGFVVLPKRWIVERSIAWLNRCRRLAKDWENLNRKALAFLRLASIRLMLRKLCNPA